MVQDNYMYIGSHSSRMLYLAEPSSVTQYKPTGILALTEYRLIYCSILPVLKCLLN